MNRRLRPIFAGMLMGMAVGFGVGSFVSSIQPVNTLVSVAIYAIGAAAACITVAVTAFRSSS